MSAASLSLRGGAGGLRANGPDHIAAFRRETTLPIIGILKRFENGKPDITPDFASAKSVSDAGADILGVDCSAGRFPTSEPWRPLLNRIRHELNRPVLADIATLDEAHAAAEAGADAVGAQIPGSAAEAPICDFRSANEITVGHIHLSRHARAN